jgi:hypothetical protein
MYLSFIYRLALLILLMWYFSKVFKCLLFFPVFIISIVSFTVAYIYPDFSMWYEYPQLLLLFLVAWSCSLYLIISVLPVCRMYFSGQCRHFIWQTPHLLCLSVCSWDFNIFCAVFSVRKAIFIRVSWKSLAILTSLSLYVKVIHFVLWCWGSVYVFYFCGGWRFCMYYLL